MPNDTVAKISHLVVGLQIGGQMVQTTVAHQQVGDAIASNGGRQMRYDRLSNETD